LNIKQIKESENFAFFFIDQVLFKLNQGASAYPIF